MANVHQHEQYPDSSIQKNLNDSSSLLVKLRQRWELASVLNFFNVFKPLIDNELKFTAEEIEDALINPNDLLSKLHITLLKGIPPVSKNLSKPDAWVTILCKKFAEWWEWVAEGDVPLSAAKGEEIPRYKELDPITRLLMLKALCEIRTEQDDLASYINDALKKGEQLSQFRKDKIGEDKNGTSYWYDGNSIIGHRLYREVKITSKQKYRGKNYLDVLVMKSEWETLATNLEEFQEVSGKFSSCQVGVEAAVHETIETEIIPVLKKIKEKKERDLKRRQREETLALAYAVGVTRSCRTRRTVKYTFDEYDRTIDEAIELTRKAKSRKVEKNDSKHWQHGKRGGDTSIGNSLSDAHSDEEQLSTSTSESKENGQSTKEVNENKEIDGMSEDSNNKEDNDQNENDEEDDQLGEHSDTEEQNDLEIEEMSNMNVVNDSESSDSELENGKPDGYNSVAVLSQGKKKSCDQNLLETRNPEAKNRYRQRPVRNTSFVVSDSEEGSSAGEGEGDPSEVADTEDDTSS